jgi:hypothetical protein
MEFWVVGIDREFWGVGIDREFWDVGIDGVLGCWN